MTIIQKTAVTASALALASFLGSSAFAQQQRPPAPQPMPEVQAEQPAPATSLEGELVRVDTTARLIVVMVNGVEEELAYTDSTLVTGADRGIAGLANADGTHVTVKFTGSGDTRVATEIKVHPKKS